MGFFTQVEANVIRISRDDNDVFSALTVDSFCIKNVAGHEEVNREKNEDLWTQVPIGISPEFQKSFPVLFHIVLSLDMKISAKTIPHKSVHEN